MDGFEPVRFFDRFGIGDGVVVREERLPGRDVPRAGHRPHPPDWGPVTKTSASIVINRGRRTCHSAIVARELGLPAVLGAEEASLKLQTADPVTVSCAKAETGRVYRGAVPNTVERTIATDGDRPATEIIINLGNPALAFKTPFLSSDGGGLARTELIVSEHLEAHPHALLHPGVSGPTGRGRPAELVQGFADGAGFFVQRLSEGIVTVAAALWPEPVVVRMSDR